MALRLMQLDPWGPCSWLGGGLFGRLGVSRGVTASKLGLSGFGFGRQVLDLAAGLPGLVRELQEMRIPKMFGAYWVAASFVKEFLVEPSSSGSGAGDTVGGIRPADFCANSADKLPRLWVVGRQRKPSSGFHWGPIPAVGGLAIPHGHMNDVQ
jgi:hypothetical protein